MGYNNLSKDKLMQKLREVDVINKRRFQEKKHKTTEKLSQRSCNKKDGVEDN